MEYESLIIEEEIESAILGWQDESSEPLCPSILGLSFSGIQVTIMRFEKARYESLIKKYGLKLESLLNDEGKELFNEEALTWKAYHDSRVILIFGDFEGHSGGGGNGIIIGARQEEIGLLKNRLEVLFNRYSYGLMCKEMSSGFRYGNWRDQ